VPAGETREVSFATESVQGFPYKDTFLHVVRFYSSKSGVDRFGRPVGSFVQIIPEI
jgi:hypothetical protein